MRRLVGKDRGQLKREELHAKEDPSRQCTKGETGISLYRRKGRTVGQTMREVVAKRIGGGFARLRVDGLGGARR